MNTAGNAHPPGLFSPGNRGGITHRPREGSRAFLREHLSLAVLIVATLALGLFLTVRFIAPREPAATPPAAIATSVAMADLTATYGETDLVLRANIAGDGASVGSGTVTFAIMIEGQLVVAPVSAPVGDGVAATSLALPTHLNAGTYTVEVTYGGADTLGASRTTARLVVVPAGATVTLTPASLGRTYDGAPQAAAATTEPAGLPVALAYRRDGIAVAAPVDAGAYTVEATVADSNYYGTAQGTLVIARATPAITWRAPLAITYGTPLGAAQLGATSAVAGTFAYDPPPGSILSAGADRALTATFTPSDGRNYLAATASVPIVVQKAPLQIVAANQTRTYGSANQPLTTSIVGLVNGETSAVIGGTPELATAAVASSPVGTYPITLARGEITATNYAVSFAAGTLTVAPAPLTVTADNAARVYGAPDPPFTGTVAGVVNDDALSATFQTTARASSPVGTYPIAATIADPDGRLGNYAVSNTTGTLTIGAAESVATVAPITAQEGETVLLSVRLAAVKPSVAAVDEGTATFSIARAGKAVRTTDPIAVQAGTASVEVSLWDLDSGEYTIAVVYGDATNFAEGYNAALLTLANAPPMATFAVPTRPVAEGDGFTIALVDPTDPSAADRAAGFTFAFDRGDGKWFTPAAGLGHATVIAGNDPGQTVRARITDREGAENVYTLTVPVANVAPVVRAFLVPTAPVTHHLALPLEATFTDAGTLDRHTATWDWGDGTTSTALISEANGNITVKGEHQYARGVYALSVTVSDESGGVGQSLWRYIVIDDTEHAVAAGSARFTSPAGAVTARPNQAAPAALGFVAAYQAGVTEVRFQVADLDFAGLSYSWVPAPDGQLRLDAMGTVNGAGDYRLELTARDGNLPNGAGDRVRVAIWNRETGALVYDSQPGAASGDAPTTPLDLGEIVFRSLLPVFPRATGSGPDGQAVGLLER